MLVGRDTLLGAGDAAVADAVAGRGRLLLLTGEAGIGKTSLAHALLDQARTRGATVRVGACWETDGLPAFTPWLDALHRPGGDAAEAAAAELEGADAPIDATDAGASQRALRRRFTTVVDALHATGADAPQVILLEDLHWADDASLELLVAVAPHLPTMPVLVIGTCRPDELDASSPLATLGGRAERYDLTGLGVDAVAELLSALLADGPSADEARQVHERTGGNPLFVTQLARLIEAGSTASPAGVREVLERRLARVSTDVAEVLGAAAVLGHEFDRAAVAAIVGTDPIRALEGARAAGLVEATDDPDRWRFVHALVQTTHYDSLPVVQREAWHGKAVDALDGRPGTTAAVLAHHATRSGASADDPRPAELLIAAGREALARMAWDDAGLAFERARARAPGGDEGDLLRAEAWLGTGDARLRADRADARVAFDEAAALARRLSSPDLLARAALGFSVGMGSFEVLPVDHHQIDLLEEAERSLAADAPDHPVRPFVLARLSVALAFVDSPERRTTLAEQAVALAREADAPLALGHALAAWCDARSGAEDTVERTRAAGEIVALATRAGDVALELLGRRFRVVALLEDGRLGDVDREVRAYEDAAARLGDDFYTWFVPLWRSTLAHARGDIDAAQALTAQAMAMGMSAGSTNARLLGLVQDGASRCDSDPSVTPVEILDSITSLMPEVINPYGVLTGGFALTRIGDLAGAAAQVRSLTVDDLDTLPRDSEWAPGLVQVAVVAAATRRADLAEFARGGLEPIAPVHAVEGIGAYLHGSCHRALALALAVLGDSDGVHRHVEAAHAAVDGAGALLEASTAVDAAWALQIVDDAEGAAERARTAIDGFTAVGLDHRVTAARAYLDAGERSSPPAPTPAPPTDQPSLVRDGDTWAVSWQGTTVHVKHAKGVADLGALLERPDRELHVRELDGSAPPPATSTQTVLDETARQQYRQRLVDLEEDLDEADRHGDVERAARLAAERDALVDELTKAFGLARQGRRLGGDPDERLRKAVSARIKASIDRLDGLNPALGRHLRASVRTGFWCSYAPEQPTSWLVRR